MKTSRIVADTIETAYGENREWAVLLASSKTETVEVVFKTMQAPLIASSILLSSQDAAKDIAPEILASNLEWYLDSSKQILPEAVGIALLGDRDVLCINVGSGVLCLKLTDAAKQELKNL